MARISILSGSRWYPFNLSAAQLIKWWMILRVVLVSTTMSVVYLYSDPYLALSGSLLLTLLITGFTVAVSFFFYRAVKKGELPEAHYYIQYFFDICLISLINAVYLPADVNFTPLYVLSITVAGILSFRSGALFAATAASFFYVPVGLGFIGLGLNMTRSLELNIYYPVESRVWLNLSLQVFLFYCIALITSYLSVRLRHTGWELEDTKKVFLQYRLDTKEILENIASAVVSCDDSGIVVLTNSSAEKILGLKRWEMLGRKGTELFRGECPEIGRILADALERKKVVNRRMVEFTGKERGMYLLVSSSLLLKEEGRLRGVSLIFEDVTHEERARELALRTGKLEALAELSAALAHEIKNPLASIRSSVELLRDKAGPARAEPRQQRLMNCIIKESDRLTMLLKQFLQFASGRVGPSEPVLLGPLLEEVLESVRHHPDWRPEVRVRVSPEVREMRVMGHRDSLAQVFFNLLINSVQAGDGKGGARTGEIVIEPCPNILNGRTADQEFDKSRYSGLCFYDDGPGIKTKLREKIFEPFYTTRKSGFGLGLAVVHRIIHGLGGIVFADDTPTGAGVAFFIALPQAQSHEAGQHQARTKETTG